MVLVALAGFGLGDFGQSALRAVSDGGFVVFSVFAAVACSRAARLRAGGDRLPWWLLGGAATCYAVGNAVWFYYQVLSPEAQTYPGPADVFYVAVVPFAVASMLMLPSRPLSGAARVRAVADGLIVGAALLFVSWILVLGPLLAQLGEASWIYLAVYLYYPLTDILIVSIASGLAVRAAGRERLPLLLVAAGFVAIACADTGIGYLALKGQEAAGSGLDLGWTIGYMLLGLAALVPAWEDATEGRADPRALVRELLPYAPVALVLAIVATDPSRLADDVLTWLLLAVVVLLIARHLLTLADNVRLTGGLEDLVRQRTQALVRLTRRHQSILDGAGEGIVGLDRSGRVTFANPAAAELLGRSGDDLVGRGIHEVTRPRRAAAEPTSPASDPVAQALADGQVHVVTNGTYRRVGGVDFAVDLTVAPVRSDGDTTGAVLIFRDVTERRAIDRMKDEFVSVVSHELRTPLTSLRGALGLLQGGLLRDAPPRAQQMLGIAVRSTDRLIRLINDILDVERMAAGKLTLDRQEWSAGELVSRAAAEMSGLAAQEDVRLEVGDVAGRVDADGDRVVQTLTNLLSNAIKFSPAQGTVRLAATAGVSEVLFSVGDQGPGIPGDQHSAVFGRFAQVDASDTREKEGSGLGLAICRGIVEQHGGRIWVESEPGMGTTLLFTLPAAQPRVAPEGPPTDDDTVPTVLVCEADPATRAAISECLGAHGYRVVPADSGDAAVTLARDVLPSAVLIDVATLGTEGWEATAALQADEATRDIPVLIVSGAAAGSAPVEVAAWLTRPLDVAGLLTALRKAIAGGSPRPCVLVVEDDVALTEVLASMFAEHGVATVSADNARDALRLTRGVAPDLLLLDLLLPGSDGFTLVDRMREDPRLSRVPLVVYSALDLDDDEKQRLRLGPTEFFTKARTSPEEVERRVLHLLQLVVAGAGR